MHAKMETTECRYQCSRSALSATTGSALSAGPLASLAAASRAESRVASRAGSLVPLQALQMQALVQQQQTQVSDGSWRYQEKKLTRFFRKFCCWLALVKVTESVGSEPVAVY